MSKLSLLKQEDVIGLDNLTSLTLHSVEIRLPIFTDLLQANKRTLQCLRLRDVRSWESSQDQADGYSTDELLLCVDLPALRELEYRKYRVTNCRSFSQPSVPLLNLLQRCTHTSLANDGQSRDPDLRCQFRLGGYSDCNTLRHSRLAHCGTYCRRRVSGESKCRKLLLSCLTRSQFSSQLCCSATSARRRYGLTSQSLRPQRWPGMRRLNTHAKSEASAQT